MTAIFFEVKKIISKLHAQFPFDSVLDISYEYVQNEFFFQKLQIFWIEKKS